MIIYPLSAANNTDTVLNTDVYKRQVMNTAEMHTIEHLGATFLRNHPVYKDKTIYFGPMGCRTGFYMLLAGDYTSVSYTHLDVYKRQDLKCSVETCCFHDGDCCCRNDIMVGGAKACSCDETCCENFEQQKEGSARNADGYPDRMTQIDCEAVKCRYNTNYKCQAAHVDMRGCLLYTSRCV